MRMFDYQFSHLYLSTYRKFSNSWGKLAENSIFKIFLNNSGIINSWYGDDFWNLYAYSFFTDLLLVFLEYFLSTFLSSSWNTCKNNEILKKNNNKKNIIRVKQRTGTAFFLMSPPFSPKGREISLALYTIRHTAFADRNKKI